MKMWAVMLVNDKGKILHTVGFKNKPIFQDMFFLGKEIFTDSSFNDFANDIWQVHVKFFPDMNYDDIIKEIDAYNMNL